jgi:hypothetical protein
MFSSLLHSFLPISFQNLDSYGMSNPVTPKKNARAFGGSGAAASSEWYDAKLQNCIDFEKPGMFH